MTLEFIPPEKGFRKFTIQASEIEKVRKEAIDRGQSPDAAEAAFRKRFEQAKARVQS